ncbi:hypothetical protein DAI22_01g165600 [Oryza sativa Japonica Group]|nr:hypothetical protein DAI22_01g165600 [Oryza sativa Japonica Group]KAF2950086.1 hypothetical protein DAI22_01g165600 [Oryza sativa Japonica Group]
MVMATLAMHTDIGRLNLQHVTSLHKISSEYPVIIDDYQAGSIQNMIHCHRVKPKFRR